MTQRQSQVNLLSITEFASICRTTPRTIRFYEQKGLIKPIKVNRSNGYRFYDPYQARNFLNIKLLQNFNLPLRELKAISQKNIDTTFDSEIKKLKKEIEQKQSEMEFLKRIKNQIYNINYFKSALKTKNLGPYILFCRIFEPAEYTKITDYISELQVVAKTLKLAFEESEITFYLDHMFKPKNSKLEISLIIRSQTMPKINLPKDYYFKKLPKTRVRVFDYIGPYNYLPLIYKNFYDFMDQENISYLKNGVFERYIQGPLSNTSPFNYITQIGYPSI